MSKRNTLLSLTWDHLFLSLIRLHSTTDQISKYVRTARIDFFYSNVKSMGIILEKKKQYEQPKHPPLFDLGPPLTNYSKCFIQQLIKYQNMFQFFCLISFILMSNLWVLYQRRKNKMSNRNALLSLTWGNLFLSLLKLHSITDQISKYQTEKPKHILIFDQLLNEAFLNSERGGPKLKN